MWPIRTCLEREVGRPVLLFFAHPACPCTRASAGELARLMAGAGRGVPAFALVSVPEGAPRDWADTDLVHGLAAIPGVRLVRDAGDLEAARFGVATSGQVLLYDGDGRLRFAGGITRARGHAGDNQCRDALERALISGELGPREMPVFGCALDCPPGQSEVTWAQ